VFTAPAGRTNAVAKRKDSLALFEVISKTREKHLAAPAENPPRSTPAPAAVPRPAEARPRATAPTSLPTSEPMFSTSGGRLRLSLNQTQSIVAGAALVVLLIIAFTLGRSSVNTGPVQAGVSTPAESTESAVRNEAETPRADAPAETKKPTLEMPKRVEGKYYLVIQGLQGAGAEQLKEAQDIVKTLTDFGEPAEVALYPGNPRQYIVWSLVGFDTPDDARAKDYAKTIEEMGKKYRAQGGRYDFKQRDRAGEFKPWFIRHKPAN
jgi:hypothetical protein